VRARCGHRMLRSNCALLHMQACTAVACTGGGRERGDERRRSRGTRRAPSPAWAAVPAHASRNVIVGWRTGCAPCTHASGLRSAPPPPVQAAAASRGASDAALPQAAAPLHLDAAAAAVARFEAEVAPRIAAELLSEASLEDLRLQAPALRPVGCWCTGCEPLPRRAPAQDRAPALAGASGAPAVPEALACRAHAGAPTCPARRRRACGCGCAPAAAPRATAPRHARRRPGARATKTRAGACKRRRRGRACHRDRKDGAMEGGAGGDAGPSWVGVGHRATGGQCPAP